MKKCMLVFSFLGCLLVAPVAWAQGVLVGVNVTNNDGYLSKAFQDDEINHLAENGVKTVRVGLVAYNIDFIIKAYQHDISSVVIVFPFGVAPTVLIGAYRFPNDGDLAALDAAAKASYVKSSFSLEPIMFGKWRN